MNPLVEKFGKEKRWLNYKIIKRDGKNTKVPYSPLTKSLASSTKPDDWTTFDVAEGASPGQVGIVFTSDQSLLGIDIDHCLLDGKLKNDENKEIIADLILDADTYVEVSPSGTGLHLFLSVSDGENLDLAANRKPPFECYVSGRYFTFTGTPYGEAKEVRGVTSEEALRILGVVGYPWKKDTVVPIRQDSGRTNEKELADSEILKRMFSAKNGAEIEDIYSGDAEAYDGDLSRADAALCSSLAFWTGKNQEQIERIWLASPLGSRTKTQSRADYRKRTIEASVEACTSTYSGSSLRGVSSSDIDLLYNLNSQKEKVFILNTENMCRVLRNHPKYANTLRYDEFKNIIEIKDSDGWRQIEDSDDIDIQTGISILYPKYFGRVGKQMIEDAVAKVAVENTMDSAKDFLKSLAWDGTPRLDSWLSATYGVLDDIYHRAVGANWLKGLVKRVMQPGCQFDYVLVLEGPQGVKKSTSLAILGGDWHVETNMGTDSKDFFMQFQGKIIVEFSEGETMNRTEVKRMKSIITTRVDRFRPPFGHHSVDYPRRCVFGMTTNQTEYLKDETGNRRFLPVTVVKDEADIEWLMANRDQLFAEAYHRAITKAEPVYQFPKQETLAQQEARQLRDPNTDNVVYWYQYKLMIGDKENGVTTIMAFRDCFGGSFSGKPIDRYHEMIIANIFKNVLKLTNRRKRFDGVQMTRWFDDNTDGRNDIVFVEKTAKELLATSEW